MSDETKGVDWETLDLLEAMATKGPWFASDWSQDDGPMETTVEAHEPDLMGIYPDGIAKLKVADTDGGEKPLEDSAFIAQLRSEYPAIRAEVRAKDERIKRLESEATLLRIDMGNTTELREALTATYNAAMWLASDETGREVPEWVYEAIEAAQKLGATK